MSVTEPTHSAGHVARYMGVQSPDLLQGMNQETTMAAVSGTATATPYTMNDTALACVTQKTQGGTYSGATEVSKGEHVPMTLEATAPPADISASTSESHNSHTPSLDAEIRDHPTSYAAWIVTERQLRGSTTEEDAEHLHTSHKEMSKKTTTERAQKGGNCRSRWGGGQQRAGAI